MNTLRETTPLLEGDCFTIYSRKKKEFDIPLHNHEEMELTLIINGGGARRIVGAHSAAIEDLELVFLGSNLPHGWDKHNSKNKEVQEVTIHFHKDLFDDKFLKRNQLSKIKDMFEEANEGVFFSKETIEETSPRLMNLGNITGFASVLELMSILNDLSVSEGRITLSDATSDNEIANYSSKRIEEVFDFMNTNFRIQVTLTEVAKIAGMPDASFSRFIKHRTGSTFIDNLNEIRLGHVCRMLIDTTDPVADIAYKCGFNNIANFNRRFKNSKGCTPKEFRNNYIENRVFV
jgi:AraC-like DNA-binding protein